MYGLCMLMLVECFQWSSEIEFFVKFSCARLKFVGMIFDVVR